MGSDFSTLTTGIYEQITARTRSEVNILGNDSTQELSPEETSRLNEVQGLLNVFFKDPNKELYDKIRRHDELYGKALGVKYRAFVLAVRDKFPDLEDPLSEEESMDFQLEVDRLIDERNMLNATDLDTLWIMWYATGDSTYTNRIKNVAHNKLAHPIVRGAANWSYTSHIEQGMLDDPDYTNDDTWQREAAFEIMNDM